MARQSRSAVPPVRIDVLGPLRLTVGGAEVVVPGPRRRAVLALLALAGGRSISVDELLDDVWPDEMPDSGKRALHSHISRLRGHLGAAGERLERTPAGYRLRLEGDELDAAEVRQLAARARELFGGDSPGGDAAGAVELLRLALDRWRGVPLEEFCDVGSLAAEAVQLAELRTDLEDDLLAARLAAGGDADLVGDALGSAAGRPLRERTHSLAVEILARNGRHAEAMRLAHRFRTALVEATGLDPTPAFAALERAVACGDLVVASPSGRRPVRPPTPFVGRSHELASLRHLLAAQRLVTVVGPGGIGKTRLAMEVAAELGAAGPVTVVELAVIADPAHLSDALRAALGLRTPANEDVLAAAIGVLAGGPHLVVLDNCEHLAAGCRDLADVLVRGCPDLTLLATSREPLGLAGEHVLRLGPLPVPGPDGTPPDLLATIPAVVAFSEHAARRCAGFAPTAADLAVIGDIVRRLDGLPLALELAAGRVGVLSLGELSDRLGRALDILSAPRATGELRHRTLRSTIEWSYRLLPDAEQRLFGALSIFPAGFGLDAVEHFATALGLGDDPAALLANLVDASVVVADTSGAGGAARYSLLETIRAFGGEQLSAGGERDAVEIALVSWAAAVATAIGIAWRGPGEPAAGARLRRELANLRAARNVALERTPPLVDPLITVTLELHQLSIFRGLPELWEWALELAARPEMKSHPARPRVLGAAASAAANRGEFDRSVTLAEDALRCSVVPGDRFRALHSLARVALARAQPADARRWWLEARNDDPSAVATYLASAALGACYAGDLEEAARLNDAASAEAADMGAPGEIAFSEYVRGEIAAAAAAADPALAAYECAIVLAREAGAPFVEGVATVGRVSLLARAGRIPEAMAGYGSLLEHWRRGGTWTQLWATLRNLAALLASQGQAAAAALLLAAADDAPDSPAVAGPHAAELAALVGRLRGDLGDHEFHALQERSRALSRSDVLDVAYAAIATGRTPGERGEILR